jgi:hypothetical protein
MLQRIVVACVCTALAASVCRGDVVRLKRGKAIEGKAEKHADGSVTVTLGGGGVLTLAADQVLEIELGPTPEEQYATKKGAMPASDAQAHFNLGKWCSTKGLSRQAKEEFRAAIAIDRDHAGAREALNYERDGAAWLTQEEFHKRRGEVLFEGNWIAIARKQELLAERQQKEKSSELRRCVEQAAGTGKSAAQAEDVLAKAKPEEAERALIEALGGTARAKLYAAAELGKRRALRAVKPLVRLVVTGATKDQRQAGIDALYAIGSPDTCLALHEYLYNDRLSYRVYALQALAFFPDPRSVYYILHSFPFVWEGRDRGFILSNVTSTSLRGFELVERQPLRLGLGVEQITSSGVSIGGGPGPYSETPEDRQRRAEAFVRAALLEQLTGKEFGIAIDSWDLWWRLEGRQVIGERIRAQESARKSPDADAPKNAPTPPSVMPPPLMD